MDRFEEQFVANHHRFIAGCDEVGRGPLAGPVVAACVLCSDVSRLPQLIQSLQSMGVTDSKKLTSKKRQALLASLKIQPSDLCCNKIFLLKLDKNLTLTFCLHEISSDCIDQINILNASLLAMTSSFEQLLESEKMQKMSGVLLIDGNRLPKNVRPEVVTHAVVKGDSKSSLIGLASILAKEYRDHLMCKMDIEIPGYHFSKHAGYGTKAHLMAIAKLGPSPIHRKTFKGVKEFLA